MPALAIEPRQTLHYLDIHPSGSPVVLLLHGLGVSGESWQLQVPALEREGYRIIAPDAPGFGQSSYPGGRTTIATMAAGFARLVEALDTGPVCAAGISMGGTHALQLALDYPEWIDRLVLVNTFARLRPAHLRGWLYFAFRFLLVHTLGLEAQARAVARHLFPRPEQQSQRDLLVQMVIQSDPDGYRAAMRALAAFNVEKRLHEIQRPTLVISGANDPTVPLVNQKLLAERIPGAKHIIIPDAGHAVTIDQPELFNRHLLEFLPTRS